jgi:hypothetical protein
MNAKIGIIGLMTVGVWMAFAACPCNQPAYEAKISACVNCCTGAKSKEPGQECVYVCYPALVSCDCSLKNQVECVDTGATTKNMETYDYKGTCSAIDAPNGKFGGCDGQPINKHTSVDGKDKREQACQN